MTGSAPELGMGPGRWQIWRTALRESGRAIAAILKRPGTGLRARLSLPTRLLIAPQDLRTSDPTIAHDIYGGYFVLAGRGVQAGGRSPFASKPASPAWSEELYGFGWLRHLRAADTPLARENARALLVEGTGTRNRRAPPEAYKIRIVARRLISFLSQSPLLLTGADHDVYQGLMRSIALAKRDLERGLKAAPVPADRLWAAIGLCYAGLCCEGYETTLRRATQALSVELEAQILPDGGHIGRNPATLIELLLDLFPLRQVFASRGVQTPEALERAIERMLPMVRLFRHGDGGLALFNGMGRTAVDHLATISSYDSVRGEPAQHATYSGYDRVDAGGTILIADLGAPPPVEASAQAHAGCLSFELSVGPDRLVVNCGSPLLDGPLQQAARATAAHSTMVLNDTSSAILLGATHREAARGMAGWLARRLGPVLLAGPREVMAERRIEAGWTDLIGRHDGYLARFGFLHERRLRLVRDGGRLEGTDVLLHVGTDIPERKPAALIRFHLHPSVEARMTEDGAVLMRVGRQEPGAVWRFAVMPEEGREAGTRTVLEDSVFFAAADGRRPTRQIVVTPGLDPTGTPSPVTWSFERLEA